MFSGRKHGHVYSPRKKDAEAANVHEKEQLQQDNGIRTPVPDAQNGKQKHLIGNGGSKV